jgi:SAM-dependent methyltransferase
VNSQQSEAGIFGESGIWKSGYIEGDPLVPMGPSVYSIRYGMGHISILHAVFRLMIRPYVKDDIVALEIGPGRGAWSKAILSCGPKHLHVCDPLSAEHNGFWEYVGGDARGKTTYHQVTDAELATIPDSSVDYVFSFGCFCHISPDTQGQYLKSMARVMKPGAIGFIMYADYDKWNAAMEVGPSLSLREAFTNGRALPMRLAYSIFDRLFGLAKHTKLDKNDGKQYRPGRWFHVGPERMAKFVTDAGMNVDRVDVDILFRDPIIQFRR